MSLVRDMGMTLPAMEDRMLVTCSYVNTCSTVLPQIITATADLLITTGPSATQSSLWTSAFGRVIDRIGSPLGTLYHVAMPVVMLNSTRGSTDPNRSLGIGVKLQHGDSSAGGDMVDYATGSQPADRIYFSTARTCDQLGWEFAGRSTGPFQGASNPASYDLRAAKQYIRTVARLALIARTATTEATGDEGSRVSAAITFLSGQQIPQNILDKGPTSTATSTI